jgi:hypothetical protein
MASILILCWKLYCFSPGLRELWLGMWCKCFLDRICILFPIVWLGWASSFSSCFNPGATGYGLSIGKRVFICLKDVPFAFSSCSLYFGCAWFLGTIALLSEPLSDFGAKEGWLSLEVVDFLWLLWDGCGLWLIAELEISALKLESLFERAFLELFFY